MTREEIMKEFVDKHLFGDFVPQDITNAILDEIIRLRSILDKLREPFKYGAIVAAIDDAAVDVPFLSDNVVDKIIQAAVKAAEREVMYSTAAQDSAFMDDMRQLTE